MNGKSGMGMGMDMWNKEIVYSNMFCVAAFAHIHTEMEGGRKRGQLHVQNPTACLSLALHGEIS